MIKIPSYGSISFLAFKDTHLNTLSRWVERLIIHYGLAIPLALNFIASGELALCCLKKIEGGSRTNKHYLRSPKSATCVGNLRSDHDHN